MKAPRRHSASGQGHVLRYGTIKKIAPYGGGSFYAFRSCPKTQR